MNWSSFVISIDTLVGHNAWSSGGDTDVATSSLKWFQLTEFDVPKEYYTLSLGAMSFTSPEIAGRRSLTVIVKWELRRYASPMRVNKLFTPDEEIRAEDLLLLLLWLALGLRRSTMAKCAPFRSTNCCSSDIASDIWQRQLVNEGRNGTSHECESWIRTCKVLTSNWEMKSKAFI